MPRSGQQPKTSISYSMRTERCPSTRITANYAHRVSSPRAAWTDSLPWLRESPGPLCHQSRCLLLPRHCRYFRLCLCSAWCGGLHPSLRTKEEERSIISHTFNETFLISAKVVFSFHRFSKVCFLPTDKIVRKIVEMESTPFIICFILFLFSAFIDELSSPVTGFPCIASEFIHFTGCHITCGDTVLCNWPQSIHICIFSAN